MNFSHTEETKSGMSFTSIYFRTPHKRRVYTIPEIPVRYFTNHLTFSVDKFFVLRK